MTERPKTVWILGSGFSKGIGAPLLYELLTEKGLLLAQEVFPHTPLRSDVYELFGKYGPASKAAKYWEHAEEFLDLVDAATEPVDSPPPDALALPGEPAASGRLLPPQRAW